MRARSFVLAAALAITPLVTQVPTAHADELCAPGVMALGNDTSCPFAVDVANAWRNSYIYPDGGLLQGVYSPVTGEYYNLDCSKVGAGVVCMGGNGAAVNIF